MRAGLARFLPAICIVLVQLTIYPMPVGLFVQGAIVGGLTALVALGMALTYRSDRVVSFAQGDMGLAPAVLAYLLLDSWGWPWLAAVAGGLVASIALGALVEVTIIRRFQHAPRFLLTVVTIGLAQLLAGLALLLSVVFGKSTIATIIEPPFDLQLTVGKVVFGPSSVLALLAVPVAVGLLLAFLQWSDVGLAVRAAADRSDRAYQLGIPVARLRTVVWAAAGALAFVAVFLRASVLGLPVGTALSLGLLLRALASLLLGRLVDLPVVASCAVALGILETGVAWDDPRFSILEGLPVELILFLVVATGLALGGRRSRRGDLADTSSWVNTDEVRPIPKALARQWEVRWGRWILGAAGLAAAFAIPHLVDVEDSLRASAVLIYALLGLSVVVLTGWGGQVSLGQVGLFAIGGAVGAQALITWQLDVLVALPLAAGAGGLAAVIIGLPTARLRGLELAVITLAASLAITAWLLNPAYFDWVPTGRVPRPALLGVVDIDSPTAIYTMVLVVLLVALGMLHGVRSSRAGRAMLAVRDNESAAQSFGVAPARIRLMAFAISGMLAGAAGGLFVLHQQAFGQAPFAPEENLAVFTMVVVGGVAAPMGAILGAVWFQGIRWFLPVEWQFFVSGVGVVFVLLVLPGGLSGLVLRARRLLLGRVAARHGLDPAGGETVAPEPATTAVQPIPHAGTAPSGTVETEPALLEVRGVDSGYDGLQILHSIDLSVAPGQIVALLGTNGAGKSTLLKTITGAVTADRGEILLGGQDITRMAPDRIAALGVAVVPGGVGTFPSLTVAENLRAASWLQRRGAPEVPLVDVMDRFPVLESRSDDPAGQLSGGQQQILAMAMALQGRPRLLLVDEMSLGLAPTVVADLVPLLAAARDQGTAVVLVEQSVDLALSVADSAAFLEKGAVRFSGPASELHGRTDLLRAVFLPPTDPNRVRPRAARPVAGDHVSEATAGGVPALATEGLSVSFGGNHAVRDVSIEVGHREIVGIIGANGAGKTTLFDLISGVTPSDSGRVLIGGTAVEDLSPAARARGGLGRSFQDARLFPTLTVEESIAVACERWIKVRDPLSAALYLPTTYDSERRVRRKVAELIELLGLGAHASHPVRELSTGTRRIVDIACLLAHRPTVILLDEPSAGIAQREVEALSPFLLRIRDEMGASLVIVEHDMPLVCSVAERLIALDEGAVVAQGLPDDVLADPSVVAAYLGAEPVAIDRSRPLAAPVD